MIKTYLHRPGLEIGACFSKEHPPAFRYLLSATKKGASSEPKTVCAVMQNPSYACVEFADKSVQVLERAVFEKDYTEFRGVGRLIIVNQFAFIQTNGFDGTDDKVGPDNDFVISRAIQQADIVLVAWGKCNKYSQRQNEIRKMIRVHKSKKVLQTSRHPSRVVYDGFIEVFGA